MKNIYKYIILAVLNFSFFIGNAQNIGNLDGIAFQAVAIDDQGKEIVGVDISGNPVYEKAISVRFTILKGQNGPVEYQETHSTNTDKNGLFSLTIGHGDLTGQGEHSHLMDIPWISADQFLQVEIAIEDRDYRVVSLQKFMSVPYAFYTDDIADDAITTAKVLDSAILNQDIATSTVDSRTILNESIVNEDIANSTIDLTTKVTDILPVPNGGTGTDSLVSNSLILGNGTDSLTSLGQATDGQIPIGVTGGAPVLGNISAGAGIVVNNTPGGIEISSPPVGVGSDGEFTIPVGSNGTITKGTAWYSPNSLKIAPAPDKPFAMGDIFLASANVDLKGCILSVYLQSIDGSGDANVQVVIFNPINNGDQTLQTPVTFKFLLVK